MQHHIPLTLSWTLKSEERARNSSVSFSFLQFFSRVCMTYIYRVWKTSKRMKYDKQIVTSNISKIIKVFDIHKIKEKTIWWIKWRVWLPEAGQCSLALQALDGSRLLLTPVYKQFIYLFIGDEESRMNTLFLFCSSSYHRKIVINHSKIFLICCFFLPYLLKWIFLFLFNFWFLITFAYWVSC